MKLCVTLLVERWWREFTIVIACGQVNVSKFVSAPIECYSVQPTIV